MAALNPSSCFQIATPLAANMTIPVTVGANPPTTVTITGGSVVWTRILFETGAADGSTERDCVELLGYLNAAFVTAAIDVVFSLTASGKVGATSNDAVDDIEIDLSASELSRALGETTFTLTPLGSQTATYQPGGIVYVCSRVDDDGFASRPALLSQSDLADGTSEAYTSGRNAITRRMSWRFLPWDLATAQTQGDLATPAWTEAHSSAEDAMLSDQWFDAYALTVPTKWTAQRFLSAAPGHEVVYALGTFQSCRVGDLTLAHRGYITRECVPEYVPSIENSTQYIDVRGIVLSYAGTADVVMP